ncbi:MAG: peptide-methionine (S)-S-oxide reductase MsrA [Candidatus Marinimicrobia bacterium]|nr:peptide-methionine (S)-S-oxide reductase MsrA [Candidatus Neomarinimicrobiota bacterium]
MQTATLGGGCFWCLEPIFSALAGVGQVQAGYSGGQTENPTYKEVCTGTTGHAEVVQIIFDPAKVSYATLLEVFFTIHDPTTLNRQGADTGTQYRSAVFYHDSPQQTVAKTVMDGLSKMGLWDDPIVTELSPFDKFYTAENVHQGYFEANGKEPYCQMVIAPKVVKFRQKFTSLLKS